jgi:cation:H+ antiporter
MDILWLLIGVVLALVGAQLLVNGGVALAGRFGIPTLVVGAVIVGFGTSTPELTVNIASALGGNTDLALGNILGSNMFNICMVVGIVALITPMAISKDSQGKDLPMCLMSALMIGLAGNQLYLDKINYHEIMLSGGLTFLLLFCIYMRYVWAEASAGKGHHEQAKAKIDDGGGDGKQMSPARSIIYIALGLTALVAGGEFIVDGASGVARSFGMSERVIGLVIVGPGTSVPELVASIVAALKKQADMVIGNVLGSNIFNVFFTLGVTAIIRPIPLDLALNSVVLFNIGVSLFLVLFAWFWPKKQFGRVVGALLLVVYAAYIVQAIGG